MLDEKDFVTALVVDELVDDLAHDQHAEATRSQAELNALLGGGEDGLGAARGDAVIQILPIEAAPRIAEMVDVAGKVIGIDRWRVQQRDRENKILL